MKNDRIVMIFKLIKRGEESYSYQFDSLALLTAMDSIYAGKFKGKKLTNFDKIQDDGKMLIRDSSNVIIGPPEQNTTGYACYEIPFSMIERFEKGGIKGALKQVQCLYILGEVTELIWNGKENPLQFRAVVDTKKIISGDYSPKSDGEIKNMIFGNNEGPLITDFQKKIKYNKTGISYRPSIEKDGENKAIFIETDMSTLDVNQIIKQVKDKIIGQDEAVEAIVSNIYANQRIIESANRDLIAIQKASILLDGPTGTGKTAIIKEIADKLSLPIIITSSTAYSETGYVGGSLSDILVKLLEKAKGNLQLAQRGIVCLDEIDKLAQDPNDTNKIKMKTAVQQELLTYISGTKIDIEYKGKTIEFDTSNLTFIGMGAFTKIREQKIAEKLRQSKKHATIGFASTEEESKDNIADNTYVMTAQDYIAFGLERELIGRFSLLASTKAYSIEDYKNILTKSSISPLKMFIEFTKSFGVEDVTYDDDFIQMMAEMAYKDNFGARGLQKIVSNLKNSMLLEIMNGKNKIINLTVEMLKKSEEKNIRSF